jgi:hypothetical protein
VSAKTWRGRPIGEAETDDLKRALPFLPSGDYEAVNDELHRREVNAMRAADKIRELTAADSRRRMLGNTLVKMLHIRLEAAGHEVVYRDLERIARHILDMDDLWAAETQKLLAQAEKVMERHVLTTFARPILTDADKIG